MVFRRRYQRKDQAGCSGQAAKKTKKSSSKAPPLLLS